MSIKLLHLYYDIMNLYGEYGNIKYLSHTLTQQGFDCEICKKTITDKEIDFKDYDFIYCGAGTESARNTCIEHLKSFSEGLRSAYEGGTVMLFTGNSYEMFGKSITLSNGEILEGLNFFDFTTTEQSKTRFTGDVVVSKNDLEKPLIGFINKCSNTQGITNPLFSVLTAPEAWNIKEEGIKSNNFYGTQIVGPVLVKNPHFCSYMGILLTK